MPDSDAPSREELLATLASVPAGETADVLQELQRRELEDPSEWPGLEATAADTLQPLLDHDESRVRSGATQLLSHLCCHRPDELGVDRDGLCAKLAEMVRDEDRHVRLVAVSTGALGSPFQAMLDEAETAPKRDDWIARTLLECLQDPAPAVRKRAAFFLGVNRSRLVDAHPDPETVVDVMAAVLDDPLDALAKNRDARTPRTTALRWLDSLAERHPDRVARHEATVRALLDDENSDVRRAARSLVRTLVDVGVVDRAAVADDVLRAIEARRYPLDETPRAFALDLVRTQPAIAGAMAEQLRAQVDGSSATDRERFHGNRTVDALEAVVTGTDVEPDPPLATLVERNEVVDFDETDPLVVLAEDHPGFVAAALRTGYEQVLDDERPTRRRFGRTLAPEVARRNTAALEGVPAVLARDPEAGDAHRSLLRIARVSPALAATAFPAGPDPDAWEQSVSKETLQILEATAPYWEQAPQWLVDALVENVEARGGGSWRRRYALRALVSLYLHDHERVPDRVALFVDHYVRGTFDDPRDDETEAVDPHELDAARAGDWIEERPDWQKELLG